MDIMNITNVQEKRNTTISRLVVRIIFIYLKTKVMSIKSCVWPSASRYGIQQVGSYSEVPVMKLSGWSIIKTPAHGWPYTPMALPNSVGSCVCQNLSHWVIITDPYLDLIDRENTCGQLMNRLLSGFLELFFFFVTTSFVLSLVFSWFVNKLNVTEIFC